MAGSFLIALPQEGVEKANRKYSRIFIKSTKNANLVAFFTGKLALIKVVGWGLVYCPI
jgi:hypothetical protein